MSKSQKENLEKESLKLAPPPHPWDELALQQTSYLLKDLTSLNHEHVRSFVKTHPLIVVKNGRVHTVVGQYRTWRLHQILEEQEHVNVPREMVHLLDVPQNKISDIAGLNLFMEGLIGTLERASELQYLLRIYKKLSQVVACPILPQVKTDAQFASLLGFSRGAQTRNKPR